ncbi:hypothetical protein [Acinetobacter sp. WZC-1]|uniref:hypothetical protein n=1 Tax=Acinetobacter sp. WZC-1 TaxID=3459034 RepID=UPI00403E22AE
MNSYKNNNEYPGFTFHHGFQWFYLSHNGLFTFTQLALVGAFIHLSIKNNLLYHFTERLGKTSLSIYMLHLPLLQIYTLGYKFIYGITHSSTLSEAILLAKELDQFSPGFIVIFLMLLIPLSLFSQEKIFTPLQLKISERPISIKMKENGNKGSITPGPQD